MDAHCILKRLWPTFKMRGRIQNIKLLCISDRCQFRLFVIGGKLFCNLSLQSWLPIRLKLSNSCDVRLTEPLLKNAFKINSTKKACTVKAWDRLFLHLMLCFSTENLVACQRIAFCCRTLELQQNCSDFLLIWELRYIHGTRRSLKHKDYFAGGDPLDCFSCSL